MALTRKSGSIFDSDANILVNPVNCVGVMGAGLAKGFRLRFPDMFKEYVQDCKAGLYKCGYPRLWISEEDHEAPGIVNFPTKDHWRNPSKLEWIEEGLKNLPKVIFLDPKPSMWGPKIAFPALGCGLGGLSLEEVEPLLEKFLQDNQCEGELWLV